jgi:hypothetical protein
MVRLQRLEDLATQMRNEASSHLAREPQAGVLVVRVEHRWRSIQGAMAAEAHDASQSQPAARQQVPISSFRAAA